MEMEGSFSKLKPAERDALLAAGEHRHFATGDTVLDQGGEREEAVYVVADGVLRIERQLRVRAAYRLDDKGSPVRAATSGQDAKPTRLVLQRLTKGSIFGEMSFLAASAGTTEIVAEKDSDVIYISRAAVQKIMDTDVGFAGRFYHSLTVTLTRRIRQTNKLVT
jgi:CRP-like cAMP-binding protein